MEQNIWNWDCLGNSWAYGFSSYKVSRIKFLLDELSKSFLFRWFLGTLTPGCPFSFPGSHPWHGASFSRSVLLKLSYVAQPHGNVIKMQTLWLRSSGTGPRVCLLMSPSGCWCYWSEDHISRSWMSEMLHPRGVYSILCFFFVFSWNTCSSTWYLGECCLSAAIPLRVYTPMIPPFQKTAQSFACIQSQVGLEKV